MRAWTRDHPVLSCAHGKIFISKAMLEIVEGEKKLFKKTRVGRTCQRKEQDGRM